MRLARQALATTWRNANTFERHGRRNHRFDALTKLIRLFLGLDDDHREAIVVLASPVSSA